MSETQFEIGLHASIVAIDGIDPLVLTVPEDDGQTTLPALPFGPFDPAMHRTMEAGLRLWVEEQVHLSLGYVEQLYTFGDRGRVADKRQMEKHFVSVGYLALVRRKGQNRTEAQRGQWRSWYVHFPWEDWRTDKRELLETEILPALYDWASSDRDHEPTRIARIKLAFASDGPADVTIDRRSWDEERVLERYELMYEAGLVDEAVTDQKMSGLRISKGLGAPLAHDHRRILATAIARLRAKLKYRPVVFELMPEEFTLTELQKTVESLSGKTVHKQNFRRLVEKTNLVEPTGSSRPETGGRPAALFRFMRTITRERPVPGLRV